MKEIHWLIIKLLLEGQGSVGTLSWNGSTGGHFSALESPALEGHLVLPLYLARVTCSAPALTQGPTSLNPASEFALAQCFPVVPTKPVDAHGPNRGCPLNVRLWWPGGLVVLSPTGLKQLERVPGRLPHSGHCTDSR